MTTPSAENILGKISELLNKTKMALIADLENEFIGVKEALAKMDNIDSHDQDAMVKTVEGCTKLVDAIFAKVGYDISHYENLKGLSDLFDRLVAVAEDLSKTISDIASLTAEINNSKNSEKAKDEISEKIRKLTPQVINLIREIVELVRAISDMEWENVKSDLIASGEEIGSFVKDNILTKDFARKVLDHILMTLLKNAQYVFKDEIDFVKFAVENEIKNISEGINAIATDLQKEIKKEVGEIQMDVKNLECAMRETLNDASNLYERLQSQLKKDETELGKMAEAWQTTIKKFVNAMNITYSVLEFIGILEEKQITLELPKALKDIVGKVSDMTGEASKKIGEGAAFVTEAVTAHTEKVVDTLNSEMKTLKDVTGMGVAAAGAINLQIQCVDNLMADGQKGLEKGLASIASSINQGTKGITAFAGDAQAALNTVQSQLEQIKNFRYPIKVNVISWEKLADLFTHPVEHFKTLYPINSMQDAEDLMRKIMGILHTIEPDIPDFDSLKNLLEGLLRKLQMHVMKRINELKELLKKASDEAKKAIKKTVQEAIDTIWGWFEPIVTTIRNVIETLKELALALKDKMGEVVKDVKAAVNTIASSLQEEFDTVKNALTEDLKAAQSIADDVRAEVEKQIDTINKNATDIIKNAEKELTEAGKTIEDGINNATGELEDKAGEVAGKIDEAFTEMKAKMPKMPKMNLPALVKSSFADPLLQSVSKTLTEVTEVDISSIIDFTQEYNDIKNGISKLSKDFNSLKQTKGFSTLGLKDELLKDIAVEKIFTAEASKIALPDLGEIVKQEVMPDLSVWAHGMVTTVQTMTDVNIWKTRLDTVMGQLEAEFKNDLGNITGLISKEGAMKLLNDASSVKADLKKNLNITDYINILETAVNDVVLPDPEYFYTSFKNCILTVVSKLTSRIIKEVNDLKEKIKGIVDKIAELPKTFITNVKTVIATLETKLEEKGSELKSKAKALIEDIIATAKALIAFAEKVPETIVALKDFIKNKAEAFFKTLKENTKELLKTIAQKFLENLENLASQIWQRLKNQVIIPMVKYIKNQVIYFVKYFIREKVRELVKAITEVKDDVEDGIAGMLAKLPTLNALFKAEREFMQQFTPIYESVKALPAVKKHIEEFDLSKGITNLNQLPALLGVIVEETKDNKELQKKVESLALNIQFNVEMPPVRVPVEYITWIQSILSATLDFAQSEMGLKEVFTFVQALYKGIPESVKNEIAKVMPQLPSLPSNGFTDLLNDVSCSYDLDNMMCNITLLDLEATEGDGIKASLKLQVFIMIGRYSNETLKSDDEKEEDKKDGEEAEEVTEDNTVPAIFMTFMLNGNVKATYELSENHEIKIEAEGSIGQAPDKDKPDSVTDVTVGFCLSKKDASKGVTSVFHGFGSTKSLSGMLYANFGRKKTDDKPSKLLETQYFDINIGNYPQTAYILYNHKYPEDVAKFLDEKNAVDGFTVGYLGKIEDMEFVLKLRENKFFATILKDDISAKFSLSVLYDFLKGFKMDGGYSFHLDLDCNNKKIGPLTLANLGIDMGSAKGNFGTLHLGVGSSFSVALGDAVTMSFENLGMGFDLNVVKEDFSLGDFDFDFKFKFPEGIGVAIDSSAVKGAAIINYNDETGELFGALELDVIEKFGVSAMLMLDLGIRDGHFFSMLAMLSTRFSPGIPLGMGFSLTAIGGVLGLQRMLDYGSIREAVHNGTLESAFFVQDVMKHIAEMKKTAEKIFPAKKKQFFIGLLGQISYEPVVKCNIGLMLQLPDPTSIIIVGALKVAIEGTDVIKINVAFAGEIDFKKGIQFDASLYDSSIVGITLEGDMAFRLFWGGETKGFLMTIGGFHPAYKPEESMHVSDLRRLSMKLDYSVLKVALETYMAITSNTFQIGAHLDIKVGWDKFGIIGYAGFDALFQFDPFMFMFDIEAGMAVMVGSMRVLTVDLALSLSGPKPWHASGNASFSFLLIPINVSFDVTWGDKQPALPDKQIEVKKLFQEQIDNLKNWVVDEDSRRDNDVMLKEEQSEETAGNEQTDDAEKKPKILVLSPGGVLAFNQNAVPMEMKMDLCNNGVPTDYEMMTIDQVVLNGTVRQIVNADEKNNDDIKANSIGEDLQNDFAPALYKTMTNKEKLKSPSYAKYASGFTMKNDDSRMSEKGETDDIGSYTTYISEYKTHGKNEGLEVDKNKIKEQDNLQTETGNRVAYKKSDKIAVERYVKILDSIM